jgi:hypothetical protein
VRAGDRLGDQDAAGRDRRRGGAEQIALQVVDHQDEVVARCGQELALQVLEVGYSRVHARDPRERFDRHLGDVERVDREAEPGEEASVATRPTRQVQGPRSGDQCPVLDQPIRGRPRDRAAFAVPRVPSLAGRAVHGASVCQPAVRDAA